jgi:hypothetical protein
MWAERDAAEAGASESFDRAVRGCCRVVTFVMTRRVKLRVVRGQDTSRRGAAKHAKFRNGIGTSCCSHRQLGWGAELDLSSCESFDDYHGTAALGTDPRGVHVLGGGCCCSGLRWCGVECCQAERQKLSSAATGEETKVANADETFRQQMQQEATQELIER